MLLAHVQFFIHQNLQVLLVRASLNLFICSIHDRGSLTQVQDLAFGLVEPHEFPTGHILQAFPGASGWHSVLQVCQLHYSAWCCLKICESVPLCVTPMNITNRTGLSTDLLTALITDFPLCVTIQPISYSPKSPPIKCISHQFERRLLWGTVPKALQMSR